MQWEYLYYEVEFLSCSTNCVTLGSFICKMEIIQIYLIPRLIVRFKEIMYARVFSTNLSGTIKILLFKLWKSLSCSLDCEPWGQECVSSAWCLTWHVFCMVSDMSSWWCLTCHAFCMVSDMRHYRQSFCPAWSLSRFAPKKHTETYNIYKLFGWWLKLLTGYLLLIINP